MTAMQLVDSHVHLWDTNHLVYPWLEEFEPLRSPALPERYAAAWEGRETPDALVHVQADVRQDLALVEVDWVASLKSAVPVAGIVASAALERGAAVEEELAPLLERPLVKGVRRNTQDAPAGTVCSEPYIEGMVRTARAGLSIDLCVRGSQLPEVVRALDQLFAAVPDARVVLDHLGKPEMTDAGRAEWRSQLSALAAMPGLVAKVSGLVTEVAEGAWTPPQVTGFAEDALAILGPRRLMVGTDWPVVTLAASVDQWWSVVDALVAPLARDDAAQLLRGTAQRVYRLAPTPHDPNNGAGQ